MRENCRILIPAIAACLTLMVTGCVSKTDKEVETVPASPAVVQVNPPAVTAVPGTQVTTVTPAPGTTSSTTTWDNGAVQQKNTVTEPAPGVLQKQTTTTWNGSGTAPSETTTTTTTNP
jgi:PBP1b-binding outer membrane lipoprotein LpoB